MTRNPDPAYLCGELYDAAKALLAADKAISDLYRSGAHYNAQGQLVSVRMPVRITNKLDAIFAAQVAGYFEIQSVAKAIEALADEWQDEIDAVSA